MTIEDIKKLCPKAERITIYEDGAVSFRVGEFAQSVNPSSLKDVTAWEKAIRNLYADLCGMNREMEERQRSKLRKKIIDVDRAQISGH